MLSVIVPVYNAENFLPACLDSLISQTYSPIEIILVNDGSTDSSLDICRDYAKSHDGIKILNLENSGAPAARNEGLKAATGDYIGFADADDILEPDAYEYMISEAEKYSADIAQCAIYFDTQTESKILYSPKKPELCDKLSAKSAFYRNLSPAVWCKIYAKEILDGIFFQPYVIGEDMRFNLDALSASRRAVILTEPKYHYIQSESSICGSAPSEKKLTSNREMLLSAMADFKDSKPLYRLARERLLLNDTDLISKAIRFDIKADELLREISREARASAAFILFRARIPKKEKLKLLLLGFFPPLYKRLIAAKK